MAPPGSNPKGPSQGSPKGQGKGNAAAKAKAKPKAKPSPQGRPSQGASQGMESAKKAEQRMKKLETMFESFMKRAPGEEWATVQQNGRTKECWTCTKCEFGGTWISKKRMPSMRMEAKCAAATGNPPRAAGKPSAGLFARTAASSSGNGSGPPQAQQGPDLEAQLRDYEAMLSGLSKAQAGDSLNK